MQVISTLSGPNVLYPSVFPCPNDAVFAERSDPSRPTTNIQIYHTAHLT